MGSEPWPLAWKDREAWCLSLSQPPLATLHGKYEAVGEGCCSPPPRLGSSLKLNAAPFPTGHLIFSLSLDPPPRAKMQAGENGKGWVRASCEGQSN